MSTFTLSQYRQAIIDRYKDDTQFSKALKTGVDSGIYKVENGLLYLATGRDQKLCIPNIKVKGGRDKSTKSLREMLISHTKFLATWGQSKWMHCYAISIIGRR